MHGACTDPGMAIDVAYAFCPVCDTIRPVSVEPLKDSAGRSLGVAVDCEACENVICTLYAERPANDGSA